MKIWTEQIKRIYLELTEEEANYLLKLIEIQQLKIESDDNAKISTSMYAKLYDELNM